jgi:hypothetical protein
MFYIFYNITFFCVETNHPTLPPNPLPATPLPAFLAPCATILPLAPQSSAFPEKQPRLPEQPETWRQKDTIASTEELTLSARKEVQQLGAEY